MRKMMTLASLRVRIHVSENWQNAICPGNNHLHSSLCHMSYPRGLVAEHAHADVVALLGEI
jgi:hypothetical protein